MSPAQNLNEEAAEALNSVADLLCDEKATPGCDKLGFYYTKSSSFGFDNGDKLWGGRDSQIKKLHQ